MNRTSRTTLPSARAEGLIIEELTDEALVYDLERHKAHCLNPTAFLVWRNCDGKHTVSDIAAMLEKDLNAPVSDELVWLAVDQLSKNDLLHDRVNSPVPMTNFSRRAMMKRLGLAAAVAVPVVTALLVPPVSVHASTGCPTTCTTSMDCTGCPVGMKTCSGGTCSAP